MKKPESKHLGTGRVAVVVCAQRPGAHEVFVRNAGLVRDWLVERGYTVPAPIHARRGVSPHSAPGGHPHGGPGDGGPAGDGPSAADAGGAFRAENISAFTAENTSGFTNAQTQSRAGEEAAVSPVQVRAVDVDTQAGGNEASAQAGGTDTTGRLGAVALLKLGADADLPVYTDEALRSVLALNPAPRVVLTLGGTGLHPSDRTPQLTADLVDFEVPGIMHAIWRRGLESVDNAVMSRGTAGVAGKTFIANLPSSKGGIRDGLAVLDTILHLIQAQIEDEPDQWPSGGSNRQESGVGSTGPNTPGHGQAAR